MQLPPSECRIKTSASWNDCRSAAASKVGSDISWTSDSGASGWMLFQMRSGRHQALVLRSFGTCATFQNSWTLIGCAIDAGNKNGLIAASLHPTSSCDARSVVSARTRAVEKNVCSTQNVLDVARRKSDFSHAYADMSRHFTRVEKTWRLLLKGDRGATEVQVAGDWWEIGGCWVMEPKHNDR